MDGDQDIEVIYAQVNGAVYYNPLYSSQSHNGYAEDDHDIPEVDWPEVDNNNNNVDDNEAAPAANVAEQQANGPPAAEEEENEAVEPDQANQNLYRVDTLQDLLDIPIVHEAGQSVIRALDGVRDIVRHFPLPRRPNSTAVQRQITEGQYAVMHPGYQPMNVDERNALADQAIASDNQLVVDAKTILINWLQQEAQQALPSNSDFIGDGLTDILQRLVDMIYPTT